MAKNYFKYDNNKLWFNVKDETAMLNSLNTYILELQNKPEYKKRKEDWKILEKMYGVTSNVIQAQDFFTDRSSVQRIKLNIIKSVVDTIYNKIGKNKPLPMFLTEGGTWDQKSRAKKLSQYVEGQFNDIEAYKIGKDTLLDALVRGTGVLKYYREGINIKLERKHCQDILVDTDEAKYIDPTQYHEVTKMSRQKAIELFPKFEDEIKMTEEAQLEDEDQNPLKKNPNLIEMRESWVLGSKDHPGLHVISIKDCILFKEPYTKDHPPLVFLKWDKPLIGFWGTGVAEILESLQIEINKVLRTYQLSIHLTSIPKVFIKAGSSVPKTHINNKIGAIITYHGTAPVYQTTEAVPQSLMLFLEWLISQIFQLSGVSMLSAQALKPAGLNSGKALNVYNDIETERFITYGQKYQDFFLTLSERIIEINTDLANEEDVESLTVKVPNDKGGFDQLDWKKVGLQRDKFIMQAYPISYFSNTPSAKFAEVQEMMQAGLLTPHIAMKLLDYPDIQAVMDEQLSNENIIDKIIQSLLDGKYIAPNPYIDILLAQEKVQKALLLYEAEGLSENRLDLFRRFIDEIVIIQTMAETEQLEDELAINEAAQMQEQQIAADQLEMEQPEMAEVPTDLEDMEV